MTDALPTIPSNVEQAFLEDEEPTTCCKRCSNVLNKLSQTLGIAPQASDLAWQDARNVKIELGTYSSTGSDIGNFPPTVGRTTARVKKLGPETPENKSVTTMKILRNYTSTMTFADLYLIQDVIARGGFGTTYKATEKKSGRVVVVKKPDNVADHTDFKELMDKTHPHVVRVFDFFTDNDETHIVMEYCAGGDLYAAFWKLTDKEGKLSNSWCAQLFRQILEGVVYLHNQFKQSHNDIKPENILLDREPQDANDVPRAMIGDFGCVATYGEGKGGDPRYCAIEVLSGEDPNATCDVWALGVTLHELLTGELLFVDHHNISGWTAFTEAKGGKLFTKLQTAWDDMREGRMKFAACAKIKDKEARGLCQQFLQVDPKKRINLQASLQHKWFQLPGQEEVHLNPEICQAHAKSAKNFKLRSVLLSFVVNKLQGGHIQYYKRLWNKFDVKCNGVLDFEEFSMMWDSIEYPKGKKKPEAKEMFEIVDMDSSGDIQFDEFVAFTFDPGQIDAETREQYFRSAFSNIAALNGGAESESINLPALEALFSEEVQPLVHILFEEIDTDGDGAIDYDEFSKHILHLCEA